MRNKLFIYTLSGFLLLGAAANANPDNPVAEGKTLFTNRCAACHNVNKVLTGPALAGVSDRRSEEWIVNFVHSSQAMVKNGDKDAIALFEKFNRIPMPDHQDLTAEDIKGIIEFIRSETKAVGSAKAPFAKPFEKKQNYLPVSIEKDSWLLSAIGGSIILLIGALLLAARVYNMKEGLDNRNY